MFLHRSFSPKSFAAESWSPFEVLTNPVFEPFGTGPDGKPRIVRRETQSDTFIPADVLYLQRLHEDEILLSMIAQVVTSGGMDTWRRR